MREARLVLGRWGALLTMLGAAGALAAQPIDPLTRPITGERTAEWLAPKPPARVFGNTYLVGFGGLSVALIDTGQGLILIDGALPQAAPAILANVRRLGFDPRDVRYILSTESHFDHAGGLAALARDTGATVVASERGAEGLRSGRLAADDPQRNYDSRFPPVRTRMRVVRDRELLKLGNTVVTAHATPGHTAGSTSWSWRACEARRCRTVVFASSLNPVAAPGYRFSAPSSRRTLQSFRGTQAAVRRMPCDILITAHPDPAEGTRGYSDGPGACRAYSDRSDQALATRLADERAGKAK